MTIVDPPLKSNDDFYTMNTSFVFTSRKDIESLDRAATIVEIEEAVTIVDGEEKSAIVEKEEEATIVEKEEAATIVEKEKTATIVGKEEKEDPFSIKHKLSKRRKWFILSFVTLQGFLGPLTSSIYVPAIVQVRESLHASFIEINATIALYVFVMGLAPLFWAALSEKNGRRAIYILSTSVYVGTTVGCAVTSKVSDFIALRAFQAVGASAAQAVGAGTITDIFDVEDRGNAMGLFLLGALIGPVLGPITGGFINEFFGWRYIFWCLTGLGGLTLLLIICFLPETSAIILRKRVEYKAELKQLKRLKRQRKMEKILREDDGNLAEKMKKELLIFEEEEEDEVEDEVIPPLEEIPDSNLETLLLPFRNLLKPTIVIATTPYSIAYGFMYFVIASLPQQLVLHYHFLSYQIGLSYLANGIGNALGAYISGYLSDKALNRIKLADHDHKTDYLESRLLPMWLGVFLLPLGMLLYGWSMQHELPIFSVLAGLFLLGLGVGIVQTPANTYIVDANQKHSASAMSSANLLRCISAGFTPLVAPTLIAAIGNGWSTLILAIISIMSGSCVFFTQRYGKKWRQSNTRFF